MDSHFTHAHLDFSPVDITRDTATGAERRRFAPRTEASFAGRLAYGGLQPGLVGCAVLDMSDTGARVETYVPVDSVPEFFSVEICGVYNRARRCWTRGKQIGLEFIFDDTHCLDEI